MFATFFTKPWQDALQLSLFNYLSVIFQSMPTPSLMDAQRVAMNNSKVTSYILVCLQVKLYRNFLFLVWYLVSLLITWSYVRTALKSKRWKTENMKSFFEAKRWHMVNEWLAISVLWTILSDLFTSQEILNIGRNKFDQGQKVRVDLESSSLILWIDWLNRIVWIELSELNRLNRIVWIESSAGVPWIESDKQVLA